MRNRFNLSLLDIVIDNTIKKGAIQFGEDWDGFYYAPRIESDQPIICGSRASSYFTIRQAIREEEIARFRKTENVAIFFGGLEIIFREKGQPSAKEIRLDTRHHIETENHFRLISDEIHLGFGYTDEQWAKITSKHSLLLENESPRSKLRGITGGRGKGTAASCWEFHDLLRLKTERNTLKAKLDEQATNDKPRLTGKILGYKARPKTTKENPLKVIGMYFNAYISFVNDSPAKTSIKNFYTVIDLGEGNNLVSKYAAAGPTIDEEPSFKSSSDSNGWEYVNEGETLKNLFNPPLIGEHTVTHIGWLQFIFDGIDLRHMLNGRAYVVMVDHRDELHVTERITIEPPK